MIPQRKNNYYRVSGTGDTFTVDIDSVSRNTKTYCEELILNSQEIYDNKEGELYCMYSGGIDSELVMEVFLSQGIKITPVIVKMDLGLNDHDLTWAEQYCNKKNIEPIIYNLDIKKFISSGEILNLAEFTKTSTYQYLSSIKAALSLDGTVLTGQDEPYIGLDQSTNTWYFEEKERWCAWARLYESNHLTGTSCFLSWSSETLLSFMLDPQIVKLGNNQLPGKLGTYSSRKYVYGRMFPMPERTKYTGWELVEKDEIFHHENMRAVLDLEFIHSGEYNIEYNELVRLLSQKLQKA
jgi:hypothetical protein